MNTVTARKSLVEPKTISTGMMYDIEIKGVSPLIFNRVYGLELTKAEQKKQERVDKTEQERLMWRNKLHTNSDGNVILPSINFYRAIIKGARDWGGKDGKKGFASIIEVGLIVASDMILGLDKATGEYVSPIHKDSDLIYPYGNIVNGNPSAAKASSKVYKIYPTLPTGWRGEFKVCVSDSRISPDVIMTCMQYAGRNGMGDRRPLFGSFEVVGIYSAQ